MDKAALVAHEFSAGLDLLHALDQSGLAIKVALWLNLADYEDWRFVLASRRLDAAIGTKAYGLVHDALKASGVSIEQTPPLLILKMSDPFIRSLRGTFSKAKSVEGVRLGGQTIGDRL